MTTFATVADLHPRVRRDVLFTETPQGVLFHNSKGGFHINSASAYKFASLVVPHLDGRRSVAELAGGLSEPQQAMMATLIGSLIDRGFARDAGPDDLAEAQASIGSPAAAVFEEQLGYIDHYVGQAAQRFARWREAPITVLGTGPVSTWCVRSLVRNGAGNLTADATTVADGGVRDALDELAAQQVSASVKILETSADPVEVARGARLVIVTGPLAPSLAHAVEQDLPEQTLLLPAWVIGRLCVMGPLVDAAGAGQFADAVRRLGRGHAADEAQAWEQIATGGPQQPSIEGPMAAMIGNHLAYEAFRVVTECLPAETRGGLILQDLDSLDTAAERFLPDPALPYAPVPEEVTDADWGPHLEEYDALVHEGEADEDPVAAALNALSILVQPHTGLIGGFEDDHWTQSPLKLTSASYRPDRGVEHRIVVADIDHVAAARLALLRQVAVRHSATAATQPGLVPDTGDTIGADRLWIAQDEPQFAGQDAVQARLLHDGSALRLPTQAVRAPSSTAQHRIGSGAGTDLPEALARATADAVAHAALLEAMRGGALGTLDLEELAQGGGREAAQLTFLLQVAHLMQVHVEALLLPAPGHAAGAVLVRVPGTAQQWAVAADVNVAKAARTALCELLGDLQIDAQDEPEATTRDRRRPIDQFDARTLISPGPAPTPSGNSRWSEVVAAMAEQGVLCAGVRTTTGDLLTAGMETATVVLVRGEGGRR